MAETFTEAQGLLFADMDTRAREVVEKKFRVRLDSAQSSENQQAAWEVYQNATVKLILRGRPLAQSHLTRVALLCAAACSALLLVAAMLAGAWL